MFNIQGNNLGHPERGAELNNIPIKVVVLFWETKKSRNWLQSLLRQYNAGNALSMQYQLHSQVIFETVI